MSPGKDFERGVGLRRLLDSLPPMISYWDRDLRCRYANRAYAAWHGVEPGDVIGRQLQDLLSPGRFELEHAWIAAALRGEPQRYEVPLSRQDGRPALVELLPDSVAGEVKGFVAHVTDTSAVKAKLVELQTAQAIERQQAHERLARSEAALRRSQRLGRVGSWELDLISGIGFWSEGMFLLYGIEPSEGVPDRAARKSVYQSLYTRQSWLQLRAALVRAKASGESFAQEAEVTLPSGEAGWFEVHGFAERADDGAVVRLVGTMQDISERKLLDHARLARQLEEQSSRNKSAFLARISHELRTPLNAVLGFSQLLEFDGAVRASPGIADKVGHIAGAAQHLLAMVDDLLDMTRIEAGVLRLASETVAVDALLADCLRWVASLAEHHRIHLQQVGAGHRVIGDRTRLRQVLVNLLSNAIKYNHEGGSVAVDQTIDAGQLAIAVRDTGRGLTPAQVDGLFQPFNRLGAERESVDGIGLGLTIAKHLVEQMNGSLTVDTQVGRGSVFTLRLPLSDAAIVDDVTGPVAAAQGRAAQSYASAAPAAVVDDEVALRPFTVLYIEDNRLNAALMRHAMARRQGVRLELALDGQAGLEAARRLLPDLLLLDMGVPLMNGTQVLEQLRADPVLAEIPCVVISANAMQADIQRALDAGCRDYITKPYSIDRVLDWVDRLRG